MAISSYVAYMVTLLIAAAIPGPAVISIVGKALGQGFWATLPFIFGVTLGDVFYLVCAISGLSFLAQEYAEIFFLCRLAGALYLLYLAWTFMTVGLHAMALKADHQGRLGFAGLIAGFVMTMGNPKTIVFYLAILPSVLQFEHVMVQELTLLIAITIIVLQITLIPYAAISARARILLSSEASLTILSKIIALILFATAIYIVTLTV